MERTHQHQELYPLVHQSIPVNSSHTSRNHNGLQLSPFGRHLESEHSIHSGSHGDQKEELIPDNMTAHSNAAYITTPTSTGNAFLTGLHAANACSNEQRGTSSGAGESTRYMWALNTLQMDNQSTRVIPAGGYQYRKQTAAHQADVHVYSDKERRRYASRAGTLVTGESIQRYESGQGITAIKLSRQGRYCICKVPIGIKCLVLLILSLTAGTLFAGFGMTCLIPQVSYTQVSRYCQVLGGLVTALTLLCAGGVLILFGAVSCIIMNECGGRALHGGKCHVNCHVFEDLVE